MSSEILHKKPQETAQQVEPNSTEEFNTDFLISPGDIYPNRKVKLENADIAEETRKKFEEMCTRHPEAFSKNNKDIGRATLIEMEINTRDSLPVAQNLYTLPLKHYEWVCSLSPWASPVTAVRKQSAPNELPRRRLCVDYRKVNSLQQG